jgi:glycosyltransferase involved in cell wall biosynthesis
MTASAPTSSPPGARGRPLRVVIVVNADDFFVSHRLALGAALRDAGYDVTVVAGESPARAVIERERLRFLPLAIQRGGRSPLRELQTLLSLLRTYLSERPDIVHHVTIKPVLYGTLAARLVGVPAIINAVSGLGFVFIERPGNGLAERALRAAVSLAYRTILFSDRVSVIFQNQDDAATFLSRGFVRQHQVSLIRGSGVDIERFKPSRLPPGPGVALLASRLLWDKGVGEFVEAARMLRARGSKARFVLVGAPDSQNPASIPEEHIREWVREGVVEWWGKKTQQEMPDILASAHVVILPSYREGMPLVLAEAAASGRACIATDVPGCREIVHDGENGWLVPVRDAHALAGAMTDALSDEAELHRRGTAGRRLAESDFALSSVIAQTLALYDSKLRSVRQGEQSTHDAERPALPCAGKNVSVRSSSDTSRDTTGQPRYGP